MEITQEVNIEMLEKLPDGTYKKKNPATKASVVEFPDGSNLEQKAIPERMRKITFGTADPSGGSNGDIYFQYE